MGYRFSYSCFCGSCGALKASQSGRRKFLELESTAKILLNSIDGGNLAHREVAGIYRLYIFINTYIIIVDVSRWIWPPGAHPGPKMLTAEAVRSH